MELHVRRILRRNISRILKSEYLTSLGWKRVNLSSESPRHGFILVFNRQCRGSCDLLKLLLARVALSNRSNMAAKPAEDEITYEVAHSSTQSPPGILRKTAYDTPLYVDEDRGPGPDDYMSDTDDEEEGPDIREDGESISNRSIDTDDDLPFPGLYEKVFYCMGQLDLPRLWCIQLVCWPWFERISMAIILLNCVTLGMYQPCHDDLCKGTRCIILNGLDHFIFAFFTLEMIIKMTAMGIIGKLGYLGETWNRLDFFIVVAGILEYSVDMKSMNLNLSAIRTIRVLRPLRAINRIPSLRILVMLLLDTLPMLGNVLMLCFFVFFIFGIIGVQLWSGKLRQRCFLDLPDDVVYTNITGTPNLTDFLKCSNPYEDFVCSLDYENGMRKCSGSKPHYEVDGKQCKGNLSYYSNSICVDWNQYYTVCNTSDANPFLNSISFDNILYAWIAIFQVITLEGWTDIMYHIQDVHNFWNWAYFVVLIVIGAFFLINLCLVVIATQFSETKQRESRLIAEQRRRFKSSSTLTSNSELGSCYDEILKYLSHLVRKSKRRFRRWRKRMQSKRQGKVMPALTLRRRKKKKKPVPQKMEPTSHYQVGNGSPRVARAHEHECDRTKHDCKHLGVVKPNGSLAPSNESLHSISYCTEHLSKLNPLYPECVHSKSSPHSHVHCTLSIHRASSINYPPTINSKDSTQNALLAKLKVEKGVKSGKLADRWKELCTENHHSPNLPAVTTDQGNKDALVPVHQPLAQRLSAPPLTNPYPVLPPAGHSTHPTCPVHQPCPIHAPCPTHAPCLVHRPSCLRNKNQEDSSEDSSSSGDEDEDDTSGGDSDVEHKPGFRIRRRPLGMCHWMRVKTREIVESKYFMRGILASILINTLSMGIEFHGQPQELTDAIEVSNLIFSSIFALEMVMKLAAYGLFGYIKNGFNVFDGIIVIVSVIEVMQQGSGGLSVLRTFRLLRILKLVRFMPALRRQLLVMLRTMDNVATFFSLLALFIFIFSVLGMHLFGCKFCEEIGEETVCDRKNFDSLLWAIVTVFQILTQEDWNIVLYNGMYKTSPWAALYFIALMTFGNYVLFNLLVAILVEGFSAEIDRQKEANLQQNASRDELDTAKEEKEDEYSDDEKKEEEDGEDVLSVESTQAGRPMLPSQPGHLQSPPVITHTAATPQGSPNITSSRPLRSPFKNVTDYLDSDSHSLSSLSVSNTPPLQRSGSINSASLRHNSPGNANHLTPYVVANGNNDRHSISSGSRVSIPSSVSNGHIPENETDGTESRRTSYISCNGGSMLSRQPSKVDLPDTQVANDQIDGSSSSHTGDEAFEDPDAIDEADCNLTKCCPEPKGCFKTRLEYSLYLLSPRNKFRRNVQRLLAHKWFDYTILIIIFANCVTLAMERPSIEQYSVEWTFLTVSNYCFTVIFTIEMGIKVIAKGFIFGKHAYINSGWNVMDGCLVMVSWIDIIFTIRTEASPEIFGILRVFRLLRTLRPLRVISRAPGLKLVVQTLMSSLRPIGNIVIICCTFFIIFGILGIQLFKGKFYYCSGPNVKQVKNRTQCNALPQTEWVNQQYNFDNLGQALMALFVLASKDGWVDIMYSGIDAVDVDQQPQRDHNEFLILYFISFLLIVGFFVLNMFVGVVVENFHKCREQQAAEEMARRLEKRRKKIELAKQRALELPYYESFSKHRMMIHNMVMHRYFDLGVALIIFLNVITMALEHYMMPLVMDQIMRYFNYIFTIVFILEAVLKIIALSFRRYIKDRWNKLDMFIVILSVVSIVLEELDADDFIPVNPTIVRTMRVLRIARVLKLLKMASGVRTLLDTVLKALPQVGNLGLLFFLLFFIFAALGVELFGRLDCSADNPCEGLGRHASFANFFIAFLTLFRIATGDNWNGIMKDTLRQENCDKSSKCQNNCCANPILAPIFFITFVLMAQFVLVNVVVAVLMKHLEESHKMADSDDNDDIQALEDKFRMEAEAEQQTGVGGDEDLPVTPHPISSNNNNQETLQREATSPRRPSTSIANLAKAEEIDESFKEPVVRVKSLPANLQYDEEALVEDGDNGRESHYTAKDETPSPIRKPAVPTIHLLPPEAHTSLHPSRKEKGTPVPPRKQMKQSPNRTLSARRRNPSQTDSLSSGESYRTCEEDVTVKPSSSFQRLHEDRTNVPRETSPDKEEVPLHLLNKGRGSPRQGSRGLQSPESQSKTPPRSPKMKRTSPKSLRRSKGSPNSLRREENSRSKLLDGNSSSGESDSQHHPPVRRSLKDSREAVYVPKSDPNDRTNFDERDESLICWDSDDQGPLEGHSEHSIELGSKSPEPMESSREEETGTRKRKSHTNSDLLQVGDVDDGQNSSQF